MSLTTPMKLTAYLLISLALVVGVMSGSVMADDDAPLFVNVTTDDPHRANMAITFGKSQLERGHPLTLFFNDKGVFVVSTAQASKYSDHQKAIGEAIKNGATVIACPMCMKHYGIKESDLLAGIKVGNPELTGRALFKDNTQSLTW